jgi:phosphoserine phosphatase
MVTLTRLSPADAIAEIGASPPGPGIGAFFDLDGTLVDVQQFCSANDVAVQRSCFYADGNEDAASMSLVGHPRPVNPRSGLAAAAAAHGWPVMCIASGRRGPTRALRYLAKHVRRDRD